MEEFLEDRGAAITVLYASDGVGENYPIHFFDAAYDADTGSAYFSELTPKEQADMLVEKAEFPRTIFTEEEKANEIKNYPLGRFAKPEDIAYGIAYLLSEAAAFVTGTALKIDGGMTLS